MRFLPNNYRDNCCLSLKFNIQQSLVITDQNITDFGYNGQNVAVYDCESLEMFRH
jgi:hypothetical protein